MQHVQQVSSARRARRGFTLVELVLAMLILSLISTAVCYMLYAAMDADSFLRSTNTAQSEIELAMRRITNNIRESQAGSVVVGTSTLSTLTQSDVVDGYANGVIVSYALQPDPNTAGQQMLVETDQRYGANPLVHNVTVFNVAMVAGVPNLYQIDLKVGSQMIEERHFKVYGRN